ncbi:hypothetical protein L6164_036523 [Bauhinia variegata]|uniref:Uncharacterized protein n=1 Tax=Bauhinia variegata TaxID=167791 RepID=A0ACB9KH67_BAUVA|nr:hypothetical protein L6164_036523 [Bauhinia variegata]
MNGEKQVIWSSNVSNIASNSTAELLDIGNLIPQDFNKETIWESFQHPTNTFVPKMKLSTNNVTGKKVQLTSWKSPSDPSTGNFSVSVERLSLPELFIWNKTQPYWRSGPWNGRVFLGISKMMPNYLYGASLGREEDGTLNITFSLPNGTSIYIIFVMNSRGTVVEKDWKNKWNLQIILIHRMNVIFMAFLVHLESAVLKVHQSVEWSKQHWKIGCMRRAPLQCETVKNGGKAGKDDSFIKLEMTKVPDFAEPRLPVSEDKCRIQCLQNCSCTAYAYDA